MAARAAVTPNRRGTRSRELVLDAAERLMAEHGYEAATVARLAEVAGIPLSSIYHYFGSKNGVLLAVMERGADRFFASLGPLPDARRGRPVEHLRRSLGGVAKGLDEHPDFLRLLIVLTMQPPAGDDGEVRTVVARIRDQALDGLRGQIAVAFEIEPASAVVDRLARFSLASFDGAFVAHLADESIDLADMLGDLPDALVAMRRSLASGA